MTTTLSNLKMLNVQEKLLHNQLRTMKAQSKLTINEHGVVLREHHLDKAKIEKAIIDLNHQKLNIEYFNNPQLRQTVNQQFEQELYDYALSLSHLVSDLDSQQMIVDFLSEFPHMEQVIYNNNK
ncbi:hypothetical protein ACAS46_000919 [Vibrio vulnificus]